MRHAALRPFAEECYRWDGSDYTPAVDDCTIIKLNVRISTLARAKAALASNTEPARVVAERIGAGEHDANMPGRRFSNTEGNG